MSRIASRLETLKKQGSSALIPYITAGDPNLTASVRLMHAMVEAGVDIIELGVPFSDPMADGPVIQAACERALANHVTLSDVLNCVETFRKQDAVTPVVIMGYLNPVESMGYERFAARAAEAGVDGVLLVDLTLEESTIAVPALKSHGLSPVFLIAPTTPVDRIAAISKLGAGYLYYVSLKGVTGAASLDVAAVADKLGAVRAHTDLPVAVGFGIRDAASAAQVGQLADGVVVGSALVEKIEQLGNDEDAMVDEISRVLREMREAMNG